MKTIIQPTYSISDFYIFMKEKNNYLICIYPYEFKNLTMTNYIIDGDLHIDNRVIRFEIDHMSITNGGNGRTNSIIIDKYIFSLL